MKLVIDIGNTFIKIGLFEKDQLKIHAFFEHIEFKKQMDFIASEYHIDKAIISSVASLSDENKIHLAQLFDLYFVTNQSKMPFNNLYTTPNTLGIDRIALVAAATFKFPKENVLIIDAGTCVTYDFIDSNEEYFGGAIAPGIRSRYKSLKEHTAQLPLLDTQIPQDFIGNSTQESIHSGVINGISREIDGIINQYKEKFEKLTIVLTGGDAEFLSKQLKSNIFVYPFFLLEGLYTISKINS